MLVRQELAQSGLPPERLELELTESVLIEDTDELIEKMKSLGALGVRFAIDDFGTRYSSLSYLKRMPIDRLKLDRTFVEDINSEEAARTIAAAVIALGNAMDMQIVAEGIEDADQENAVHEMGCTQGQGFFYSMPLPPERVVALLPNPPPLPESRYG